MGEGDEERLKGRNKLKYVKTRILKSRNPRFNVIFAGLSEERTATTGVTGFDSV